MKAIPTWWQRIGCTREPQAHTGEDQAYRAEIADLRAALQKQTAALTAKKLHQLYMKTHDHCYDGAAAGNFLRAYSEAVRKKGGSNGD